MIVVMFSLLTYSSTIPSSASVFCSPALLKYVVFFTSTWVHLLLLCGFEVFRCFPWFPFLTALREKGATDFHLANFLSNRAVKPVFLPLLVAYFGWRFALIFMGLNILGALVVAGLVAVFTSKQKHRV